jgi:hypothetical protein
VIAHESSSHAAYAVPGLRVGAALDKRLDTVRVAVNGGAEQRIVSVLRSCKTCIMAEPAKMSHVRYVNINDGEGKFRIQTNSKCNGNYYKLRLIHKSTLTSKPGAHRICEFNIGAFAQQITHGLFTSVLSGKQ